MESKMMLFKPNQLICINRVMFNRFQLESINIMLKIAQDKIISNNLQMLLSFDEILNYKYKLKLNFLLDNISYKKDRRQLAEIKSSIEELSKINIETLDKNYPLNNFNIFKDIYYDYTMDEIVYSLNDRLAHSFVNNTYIEPKEEFEVLQSANKDVKGFFTMVNISFENKTMSKSKDFSYNFIENVFRLLNLSSTSDNCNEIYELSDFKKLIGLKEEEYPLPNIFRSKVLSVIVEDFKKCGIDINLTLLGRGKYANKVEFNMNMLK